MAVSSKIFKPFPDELTVRFNASGRQVNNRSFSWNPPTDVFEANENFVIRIEIAGLHQSDISINMEGKYLVVSGTRRESQEKRAYHQIEIRFGDFNVMVDLPTGLALEKASANYEEGLLTISIPFIRPTNIKIQG
jgi:HSP20 family protein